VRALLGLAVALLVPSGAFAAQPRCNVPVTMSDGTVLRANVFLPDDASGPLPTVLTVTGYNKDGTLSDGQCAPGTATEDASLLDHGYAVMTLDERGTGASGGQWDSWGERTQLDYREVLDWIQAQPWSDGRVATFGGSYMGITTLLVAEADAQRVADGKPRAVRAAWAEVPMADAYRDVTFHGGAVDTGFIPLWLGLTTADSSMPPSTGMTDPQAAASVYPGHLANAARFVAPTAASMATGGELAYDGPFYRQRSPITRIESLRIPVAWVGGWWDIFQRGQPALYEAMVNAPHKLWFQMPSYHGLKEQAAWDQLGIGSRQDVRRRWFDRWLKGADNGIERQPDVNLYTLGAKRWDQPPKWPLPNAKYTPLHLDAGGALSSAAPVADAGDVAPLLPVSSPCSRMTFQWSAGLAPVDQCETDNRTYEATALTYTTPPLERDTQVTGHILARVWAELTGASDATLTAVLSDVAPDGKSTQLTGGFLLASQRAVDPARSTFHKGVMIRPWHPFTRESQRPVAPGEATAYDIEIYPTSNVFAAGHRIRLTIGTANTPATLAPAPSLAGQAGAIRLLHGPSFDSYLQLPVIP
jgi:putative CocE/NonD family hydrolase